LNEIFRQWCAGMTAAEVSEAFRAAGGTIAPIYSSADVAADPYFAQRGALVDVPDVDFGRVRMAGVVPRFAGAPTPLRHSAGDIGQDNDEVYGQWLGLSAEQRQRLRDAGVI
jgi:crotonobetainyl-CoA:carnitine CoA-transferase CaiB-like acyl-CoA transferase